jgi:hypothetical protein
LNFNTPGVIEGFISEQTLVSPEKFKPATPACMSLKYEELPMLPTDSSTAIIVWRSYELVIPTAVVFGQLNTTVHVIRHPRRSAAWERNAACEEYLHAGTGRGKVKLTKCEQLPILF